MKEEVKRSRGICDSRKTSKGHKLFARGGCWGKERESWIYKRVD